MINNRDRTQTPDTITGIQRDHRCLLDFSDLWTVQRTTRIPFNKGDLFKFVYSPLFLFQRKTTTDLVSVSIKVPCYGTKFQDLFSGLKIFLFLVSGLSSSLIRGFLFKLSLLSPLPVVPGKVRRLGGFSGVVGRVHVSLSSPCLSLVLNDIVNFSTCLFGSTHN